MPFTNENLLTALAIVNIFETSRPLGDYDACVVLNDGAGVSYGISQFTHRSGSLEHVVKKYLAEGGDVGKETLVAALPSLHKRSKASITRLASDKAFKQALRAAGATREMKNAQTATALDLYLRPAIEICEKLGFALPLSLAVVYDSITHGSWDRIAKKIASKEEKAWLTDYVRTRHAWLTRTPSLKATNYRTKFFLDQIATGNWALRLPMNVHGVRLSESQLLGTSTSGQLAMDKEIPDSIYTPANWPPAYAVGSDLAAKFDRIDSIITTVAARTDRAKSLWTTIGGTLWQAAWAVFGFFAGLPREVWIVVAIIAGLLSLLFLYRQIALGRIREERKWNADKADRAETTG